MEILLLEDGTWILAWFGVVSQTTPAICVGRSPTKGEGVEKAEVTGGAAGGDGSNGVVARVTRHGVALGVEPPGRLRVATGMGSMVA